MEKTFIGNTKSTPNFLTISDLFTFTPANVPFFSSKHEEKNYRTETTYSYPYKSGYIINVCQECDNVDIYRRGNSHLREDYSSNTLLIHLHKETLEKEILNKKLDDLLFEIENKRDIETARTKFKASVDNALFTLADDLEEIRKKYGIEKHSLNYVDFLEDIVKDLKKRDSRCEKTFTELLDKVNPKDYGHIPELKYVIEKMQTYSNKNENNDCFDKDGNYLFTDFNLNDENVRFFYSYKNLNNESIFKTIGVHQVIVRLMKDVLEIKVEHIEEGGTRIKPNDIPKFHANLKID